MLAGVFRSKLEVFLGTISSSRFCEIASIRSSQLLGPGPSANATQRQIVCMRVFVYALGLRGASSELHLVFEAEHFSILSCTYFSSCFGEVAEPRCFYFGAARLADMQGPHASDYSA